MLSRRCSDTSVPGWPIIESSKFGKRPTRFRYTHRAATRIRGQHYAALRSQIIRSASSVATDIVEGREQKTDPGFARYLGFSISSASELEYHLLEAREMHVVSASEHLSLSSQIVEVRMMLHGLIRRLEGGNGNSGS